MGIALSFTDVLMAFFILFLMSWKNSVWKSSFTRSSMKLFMASVPFWRAFKRSLFTSSVANNPLDTLIKSNFEESVKAVKNGSVADCMSF